MSDDTFLAPGTPVDLSDCDREPIHIPGTIQPHGVLLALSLPDMRIVQASANAAERFATPLATLLGAEGTHYLGAEVVAELARCLALKTLESGPLHLLTVRLVGSENRHDAVAHVSNGLLVVELEPTTHYDTVLADPYRAIKGSLARIQRTGSLSECCQQIAEEVRGLTGFDRVMVYRFLPDDSGEVLAESKKATLEPFLGLRYPASDIPQQARALYLRSWLRIIPDVTYAPTAVLPAATPTTGQPLDMSHAVLRSVSPLHIEYLTNMGVRASMSISLIDGERLWGLIACHHYSGPRPIGYDIRTTCEFLGQVVSGMIRAQEDAVGHADAVRQSVIQAQLLERLSLAEDIVEALTQRMPTLGDFVRSGGAAVLIHGECYAIGTTPPEATIRRLATWLTEAVNESVFATESLGQHWSYGSEISDVASGLLAVTLSRQRQSYLLWFRPEVVRTVTWAGNPSKSVEVTEDGLRLSPRKSFAAWQQTVRGMAEPWQPEEIEAARRLQGALTTVVLRQAEALNQLNSELERSNAELDAFAYIASHDLKEPLRGIHNYASFLLEDYHHQLDTEGQQKLNTLVVLTQRMEAQIETLLYYSRVGRVDMAYEEVDLHEIVLQTMDLLGPRFEETHTILQLPRRLPVVYCDRARIGEIFSNLVSNALKYNTKPERWVEIGYREQPAPQPLAFYVRDNGIGIQIRHYEAIFRIFKRLHGRDMYGGGTGAGLTIVKKIVERHGGKIWVESVVGEGTTFWFTLSP